jgi:FKBP12-rapamycin complex-associated protein
VESLISINSKLDQPEAAVGILKFAQFKYASLIDLQESWYEKLNRWEDALAGYERKLSDDIGTQTSSSSSQSSTSSSKTSDLKSNRSSLDNVLGMMRCLDVLMQWQKLQAIADDVWPRLDPSTRQHIAPKLALATWGLGKWEQMRRYTDLMDSSTAKASFYKAVIAIHDGRLEAARGHVNRSRMLIADGLTPLLAESYNRAYPSMVMVRSFEL